jgi:phasin family protein
MNARNSGNPFLDLDFSKMATEFRVPGLDVEGLMASQRRNVEALSAANQLALEGVQAVMRRQAEIVRQMMDEARGMMTELMTTGAPEEKVAKQAELFKTTFEKTVSNMKELSEMVAKSNTEAAETLAKRVSESLEEMKASAAKLKR